jgi:hypothetical protein
MDILPVMTAQSMHRAPAKKPRNRRDQIIYIHTHTSFFHNVYSKIMRYYKGSDYENLSPHLKLLHPVDLLCLEDNDIILEATSIMMTSSFPQALVICPICTQGHMHLIHKIKMSSLTIPYVKVSGRQIGCKIDNQYLIMIPSETPLMHQTSPTE